MTCGGCCSRRHSRSSSRFSCSSGYRSASCSTARCTPTRNRNSRRRPRTSRCLIGALPLSPTHPSSRELGQKVPEGDLATVFCPGPSRCGPGWPVGRVVASGPAPVHEPIVATVPGPTHSFVRIQSPSDAIDARVQHALLALVVLGTAALGAALGLALIQSRRLADPLARLARSATRLGDGDFSLSTPRSGVPEIDAIASSLDRSATRVEELLRAERSFSSHASHQLRTALTGLQLRIEELAGNDSPEVREEAEAALEQSARLLSIIEELLALARTDAPATSRASSSATSFANTSTTSSRCSDEPAAGPW